LAAKGDVVRGRDVPRGAKAVVDERSRLLSTREKEVVKRIVG
jgi:hypothetical protein